MPARILIGIAATILMAAHTPERVAADELRASQAAQSVVPLPAPQFKRPLFPLPPLVVPPPSGLPPVPRAVDPVSRAVMPPRVVCGMTVFAGDTNIDPTFVRPRTDRKTTYTVRAIEPPICK